MPACRKHFHYIPRLTRVVLVLCFLAFMPSFLTRSGAQEARINQKKIERERARKQKKAVKDYEQAVKRHNKMQSKPTRASMKQTKKESKKSTPTRR